MDHNDYVSLLEQSLVVHPGAPAQPIRDWDGKGDLPTTMGHQDLGDIVKLITGEADDPERDAKQAGINEGKGKPKSRTPLSMLENEILKSANESPDLLGEELTPENDFGEDEHTDGIEEVVRFETKESDILARLIREMDEMDSIGGESLEGDDPYYDEGDDDGYVGEEEMGTDSGYELE